MRHCLLWNQKHFMLWLEIWIFREPMQLSYIFASLCMKQICIYMHPTCSSRSYDLTLLWRHNGRDCVSNHQRLHCLLNCWFRHRSKKTSKLSVTGICVGNSPATDEFPAQKASDAENASIWWRHYEYSKFEIIDYTLWLPDNIGLGMICTSIH